MSQVFGYGTVKEIHMMHIDSTSEISEKRKKQLQTYIQDKKRIVNDPDIDSCINDKEKLENAEQLLERLN